MRTLHILHEQGGIIFMAVKSINLLKRKEAVAPEVPPVPSKEETLLTEIRDILKVSR